VRVSRRVLLIKRDNGPVGCVSVSVCDDGVLLLYTLKRIELVFGGNASEEDSYDKVWIRLRKKRPPTEMQR